MTSAASGSKSVIDLTSVLKSEETGNFRGCEGVRSFENHGVGGIDIDCQYV
jgi:hypothetical protein